MRDAWRGAAVRCGGPVASACGNVRGTGRVSWEHRPALACARASMRGCVCVCMAERAPRTVSFGSGAPNLNCGSVNARN
eukprot:2873385-Prymnesium_polylepis.1